MKSSHGAIFISDFPCIKLYYEPRQTFTFKVKIIKQESPGAGQELKPLKAAAKTSFQPPAITHSYMNNYAMRISKESFSSESHNNGKDPHNGLCKSSFSLLSTL
ncbi:hypothetical protein AMECASPLE_039753 [Ameca splendens]|uniref:Uncharacterized protein n=1 Tax=Ameca splendens TaxID=208324 RepID=A0ABV0YJK7_9TELE